MLRSLSTILPCPRRVTSTSLQVRLTLEALAVGVLTISGVTLWAAWRMDQVLLAVHHQHFKYVVAHLPVEMQTQGQGGSLDPHLENILHGLSTPEFKLWVRRSDGKILPRSAEGRETLATLINAVPNGHIPPQPTIFHLGDRTLMLCAGPLEVGGSSLGQLYLAKDITADRRRLRADLQGLIGVGVGAMMILGLAMVRRIRQALQPLSTISQVAGQISADHLDQVSLDLQSIPQEILGLAQAFNQMLGRLSCDWDQQRQVMGHVTDELRTHQALLREEESRHHHILDSLPAIICEFLPDSTLVYVNEPYCQYFQTSRDHLLGTPWLSFLPETEQWAARQTYLSLSPERPTVHYEHQVKRGEQLLWKAWEDRAFFDNQGRPVRFIRIGTDITERKHTELAQQRQQASQALINRLSLLAIEAQDLIQFQEDLLPLLGEGLDVSRTYIFMHRYEDNTIDNTAEWTAPGITPQIDQLQSIPDDAVPWWSDRMRRGENIQFADIEEIPDDLVKQVLRPQGIQAILVVPLFIGSRYYGFMGFDECRRHRQWTPEDRQILTAAVRILMGVWADEDLRRSERRFHSILQNVANVAVVGYSPGGVIHYWNQAAAGLYGYTAEVALGHNLVDLLLWPQSRQAFADAIARAVSSGVAMAPTELTMKHRDGSPVHVLSSNILVPMPAQELELFSMDIDLGPIKQAEQEREQLQAQLIQSQKMETLGRLAGGIAHDFNNMLDVIIGYGQLTLDRLSGDDCLRDNLEEIIAAGERSAALTRKLLAFSRQQALQPVILNLNQVVRGIEKMLRRLIGPNIEFVLCLGPELGQVAADPTQIEQVIMNLVVNARDAMPTGGKITLVTANSRVNQDYADQHLGLSPGNYIRLSVIDTGGGMAPETLSHIFEPFFTTKGQGQGTGLGLATVYGIVQQSGGSIWVDTTPGQGTSFILYLPQAG